MRLNISAMHTMNIPPVMLQALFEVPAKCFLNNIVKIEMTSNGFTRMVTVVSNIFQLFIRMVFYVDYIVMKKDGTVWVIETKGGETKGKNKNIDTQIGNKFNAFKNYAAEYKLQWGFVRDKGSQLFS
jgi:hypothetical protein